MRRHPDRSALQRRRRRCVTVSDEGEGIAAEHCPLVFTRFWHGTRRGGTGLGLYIVRGLVEAHGGQISVGRAPSRRCRVPIHAARGRPGARPLTDRTRSDRAERRRPPVAPHGAPAVGARSDPAPRLIPLAEPPARQGSEGDVWTQQELRPCRGRRSEPGGARGRRREALTAFAAADHPGDAQGARRLTHGDRSPLALANREIGALPPTAKAEAGKRVGRGPRPSPRRCARTSGRARGGARRQVLVEEAVDVTAPADRRPPGARHPLELTQERVGDIFVAMGWEIAEGPEVESEWFNFDALNLGADHPARQMQDTFFVDPPTAGLVLRTHTSPVQVRTMLERDAADLHRVPRQGVPHRRARRDAHPGLPPDRGAGRRRGPDHGAPARHPRPLRRRDVRRGPRTRLRPSYFPFTEPSAETGLPVLRLPRRRNPACRTCGGTGWIEWGGCGMVNRKVLRACGIDPDRYTGFAFGMGIERALMLRHGVEGHARHGRGRRAVHARSSGWRSDAGAAVLAARVRRLRRRAPPARGRRRPGPVGLEEEAVHGGDITGPLVVGRVLEFVEEPPAERQDDPLVPGRRRAARSAGDRGQAAGDRLRGHELRRRRPRRRRAARGRPARRRSRSPPARPTAMSNGMICSEARARHRRTTTTGHHRADPAAVAGAARRRPGRRRRDRAAGPGRRGRRGHRHAGPRLLLLHAWHRPRVRTRGIHRWRLPRPGAARPCPRPPTTGMPVRLADAAPLDGQAGCDRYVARVVRGIDPTAAVAAVDAAAADPDGDAADLARRRRHQLRDARARPAAARLRRVDTLQRPDRRAPRAGRGDAEDPRRRRARRSTPRTC